MAKDYLDKEKQALLQLVNRGSGFTPLNYIYSKEGVFQDITTSNLKGSILESYLLYITNGYAKLLASGDITTNTIEVAVSAEIANIKISQDTIETTDATGSLNLLVTEGSGAITLNTTEGTGDIDIITSTSGNVNVGNTSNSVTIGENSPTVDVGDNSETVNLGINATTAINIGSKAPIVNLGTDSTEVVNIGTNSPIINVGIDSAQAVNIGTSSLLTNIGTNSPTVNVGTASSTAVTIGTSSPLVNIGQTAGTVDVGVSSTLAVNIGNNAPTLNLGDTNANLNMGKHATSIVIGTIDSASTINLAGLTINSHTISTSLVSINVASPVHLQNGPDYVCFLPQSGVVASYSWPDPPLLTIPLPAEVVGPYLSCDSSGDLTWDTTFAEPLGGYTIGPYLTSDDSGELSWTATFVPFAIPDIPQEVSTDSFLTCFSGDLDWTAATVTVEALPVVPAAEFTIKGKNYRIPFKKVKP